MNDVERSLVRDGLLDQSPVEVEVPRERCDERVNLVSVQLCDEIQTLRESREAMRRAGKGPHDHGRDASFSKVETTT
jgi:hypothetical protein